MTDEVIDCHAHVFLKDMPHVANPRHRIDWDFTLESYLRTLDEHGVGRAVLAAASPYGDYNDYLIASIRGQARLRGTVIVKPGVEKYILDQMARDHVVGVRLPYVNLPELPDLKDYEYQRMLRRFADQGWHVHLHLDGPRLPQVLPVLAASGVNLVVDHFGRPDPKLGVNCAGFQAMLKLMENGRTWVKVSAAYRLGKPAAEIYGRELLKQAGPDRLLWASDCPFVGHHHEVTFRETMDDVLAWVPAGEARRKIFGANAAALCFGG